MAAINSVLNKRPGKKHKMSDRETYLLKAILNLLLYVGQVKGSSAGSDLLFTSANSSPNELGFKIPINMG